MGGNCIPNWILHGEIKAGCHKQGILTQENLQRRAQEFNLLKFDQLIFAIGRNKINTQAQIFQNNWGKKN